MEATRCPPWLWAHPASDFYSFYKFNKLEYLTNIVQLEEQLGR